MKTPEVVTLVGQVITLVGALILAFRLGHLIKWMAASIQGLLLTVKSMTEPGDIIVFEGFDEKISSAKDRSYFLSVLGAVMVVTGYSAQVLSSFL